MTNKLAQLFDAVTVIRDAYALPQWGRLTIADGMLMRNSIVIREALDGDAEAIAVLDKLAAVTGEQQWPEQRMDVIGQNGNDGEHCAQMPERLESTFPLEKLRVAAELLPCRSAAGRPSSGAAAITIFVRCENDDCEAIMPGCFSPRVAVTAWNRRASRGKSTGGCQCTSACGAAK